MSINPEVSTSLTTGRFKPGDLARLDWLRNDWGTISLYAADGSEFLDFDGTQHKLTDYHGTIWEPTVYTEVTSLYSPVIKLDEQMVTHWISRTSQFKSNEEPADKLAEKAIRTTVGLSEKYKYQNQVKNLVEIVDLAISQEKLFRTKLLLDDLNDCYMDLGHCDVWLIAHQVDWSRVVTGKLAGFSLVGEGTEATIEAIIENDRGVRGLFPIGSSLIPTSYLKDDGLVKSLQETIF